MGCGADKSFGTRFYNHHFSFFPYSDLPPEISVEAAMQDFFH